MNLLPGPAQIAAICLSISFPLLLLCYGRIIPASGRRFRFGSSSVLILYAITCVALPAPVHAGDVIGGLFLLLTAMMFCYILFSLLAWGFTLTLLTSLAKAGRPLDIDQWATAYMQGGDIGSFAHNRLKLLRSAGMLTIADGRLRPTAKGWVLAHIVKFVRKTTGLG